MYREGGTQVPLYLCVPADVPESQYNVTTIKKSAAFLWILEDSRSQRSELCYSESHSLLETSPVVLSCWINYKSSTT